MPLAWAFAGYQALRFQSSLGKVAKRASFFRRVVAKSVKELVYVRQERNDLGDWFPASGFGAPLEFRHRSSSSETALVNGTRGRSESGSPSNLNWSLRPRSCGMKSITASRKAITRSGWVFA